MNELGYNQLMRALKHFEFSTKHKISISKMEEIFTKMSEGTLRKQAYLSPEELTFINYRFGLRNGKIKKIEEASKKFEKSIEEIKEFETDIVRKIKRYIETNFSNFVN